MSSHSNCFIITPVGVVCNPLCRNEVTLIIIGAFISILVIALLCTIGFYNFYDQNFLGHKACLCACIYNYLFDHHLTMSKGAVHVNNLFEYILSF